MQPLVPDPALWLIAPACILVWALSVYEVELRRRARARLRTAHHDLRANLEQYAKLLHIPVTYVEALQERFPTSAKINGTKTVGRWVFDYAAGYKIEILASEQHRPEILAHELGHHEAITKHYDFSEAAADREGREIIRRVVGQDMFVDLSRADDLLGEFLRGCQ